MSSYIKDEMLQLLKSIVTSPGGHIAVDTARIATSLEVLTTVAIAYLAGKDDGKLLKEWMSYLNHNKEVMIRNQRNMKDNQQTLADIVEQKLLKQTMKGKKL